MHALETDAEKDVLVIGETLLDIVRNGNNTEEHPGGSPYNVAVGLSGLGQNVGFHTRIGSDFGGRRLKAILADAGVVVSSSSFFEGDTSTALATIGSDGAATYEFQIDWDIAKPAYRGESLVHVGSISAFLEPGVIVVNDFLESLPKDVVITFDPNIRPTIIGEREDNLEQFERIARLATVVKMSDEDAAYLFPGDSPEQVVKKLLEDYRVKLAVVTKGVSGAVAGTKNLLRDFEARKVEVVDTIGAGDSFTAGLINALLVWPHSFGKLTFGSFTDMDMFAVINYATECAAFTVGKAGAVMPTELDMESGIIKE